MSPRTAPSTAAPAGAHAGQAPVEYLLIIGVIAVLCLPAPPIGTTTAAAPVYTYPANDAQYKQGRWATYVTERVAGCHRIGVLGY